MDTRSIISGIEAALADQLALAGGDPVVAAAGEALVAALRPALSSAVMDLAEQAALEVGAQFRSTRSKSCSGKAIRTWWCAPRPAVSPSAPRTSMRG